MIYGGSFHTRYKHGDHSPECIAANRAYHHDYRRRKRLGLPTRRYEQNGKKSLLTRYVLGDRSLECIAAYNDYHRVYQREYRQGRRRKHAVGEWSPSDEALEPDETGCLITRDYL